MLNSSNTLNSREESAPECNFMPWNQFPTCPAACSECSLELLVNASYLKNKSISDPQPSDPIHSPDIVITKMSWQE